MQSRLHRPINLVWLALTISTVLKVLWATHSGGTVDVLLFKKFAEIVSKIGICRPYEVVPLFNHTPLTAYFVVGLNALSNGSIMAFAPLLRYCSIIADIALILGLLRYKRLTGTPPWWGLTLFALSPVSLMVSGFHGNIDPIMTTILFFAALACVEDRPILSGVLYGLACNVKIVPLALGPAFFFFWIHRRNAWRFSISAAIVVLLGWGVPLLYCPKAFLRGVLAYGSYWGTWGTTYLLRMTGWSQVQKVSFIGLTPIQNTIVTALKVTAVSSICIISWRRRKSAPEGLFTTLAVVWAILFTLAPGIGVQYMVWFAPFLLISSATWYAVVTSAATILLVVFYHLTATSRHFPWTWVIPQGPEVNVWGGWGLICWVSFIAFLVADRGRIWKKEDSKQERVHRESAAPAIS